jgi:hypothetical protein
VFLRVASILNNHRPEGKKMKFLASSDVTAYVEAELTHAYERCPHDTTINITDISSMKILKMGIC